MKKITDILLKILSPSVFAVSYITYLSLNMMTVVNVLDFTRYFLVFFAAWGFAICVKTYLFSGKNPYLAKNMPVLLVFLAFCFASMLVNFNYGGVSPIGKLAFFALCILLLYSQYGADADSYKKTLVCITRLVSVVITLSMLVSLIMFAHLYTAEIVGRSGATTYVGVAQNRLFGVFSSPNVGGMYALILIWCAVVNIYTFKKSKLYAAFVTLSIFQILISVTYISLSLSRGTYLAGLVMLVSFLLLRKPFKKELSIKFWQTCALRIVSAALVTVLTVSAVPLIHDGYCSLTKSVVMSECEKQQDEQKKTEKLEVLNKLFSGHEGRVENAANVDVTNKRKDIWLTHLSLVANKNILFGVNEPLVYYNKNTENGVIFSENTKKFVEWASGNMHNGYLQILVHCGVFAFASMLVFLILAVIGTISFLIKCAKNKDLADGKLYTLFSLAMPMVLAVLSNNVVETNFVLMGANFFQAVFWFVAGICVFCFIKSKEKNV